jgi:transposase InsO family protein
MNEIRRNERNEAKVVTPLVVTRPMEQLQMDLIDMHAFANKNSGVNYVLVVVDCFSKYLWVFPLKDKQAKSVIDSLSALFMRYEGFPRILQSDNGGEFAAKESRQWYESNGIIYRTSRPNRPSTNGQVERTNGTLKGAIISDFIRSGEYSFTNWLDSYVMAYNTMVHTSTGVTPFELHKGRAMSWMPNKDTQDATARLREQWGINTLSRETTKALRELDDLHVQVMLKQQAEAIPQVIRRFAVTA